MKLLLLLLPTIAIAEQRIVFPTSQCAGKIFDLKSGKPILETGPVNLGSDDSVSIPMMKFGFTGKCDIHFSPDFRGVYIGCTHNNGNSFGTVGTERLPKGVVAGSLFYGSGQGFSLFGFCTKIDDIGI